MAMIKGAIGIGASVVIIITCQELRCNYCHLEDDDDASYIGWLIYSE